MKNSLFALVAFLSLGVVAYGQTSAFTYQGRLLTNSSPANGIYDMQFALFDSAIAGGQVGGTVVLAPIGITNGLFTATLGYGSSAFNGNNRWLQIALRSYGDTNAYTVLSNRQQITSAPYAIQSLNAANAAVATALTAPLPGTNLSGTIPDARLSTNVAFLNSNAFFKASISATQFNGSGAGLTSLPATNLTGTIPDARLSTNVAMLNGSVNFNGTVIATNFSGYGGGLTNVPGRLFDNEPVGSATQTLANTGYLATNDTSSVVLTLPLSANIRVGETIRVAASGAGGWQLMQNPGQSILVANLLDSIGLAWTPRESSRSWKAVATSVDGSRMAAIFDPGGSGGQVYTSTNSGVNWSAQAAAGTRHWSSVASSGDGSKIVATVNPGQIYTSVDSWAAHGPSQNWVGVASSLDGVYLVAAANPGGGGGQVYTSVNSGSTWTARSGAGTRTWSSVASSSDGKYLVASVQGGNIYCSTNWGTNWTASAPIKNWFSVASSQDGSKLVAAANGAEIFVSADFGTTWTPTATSDQWTSVSSSADGSRLAAVTSPGAIYLSMNSGITWIQAGGAPTSLAWSGITVSGDGSSVVAVPIANQIYVSSQSTTTIGTAGYLTGTRLSAIDLMYVGNDQFMPVTQIGTIRAH